MKPGSISSDEKWGQTLVDNKKDTHIALITHILDRMKYKNKNEKLVSHNYGLVDPATPEIIKDKLF